MRCLLALPLLLASVPAAAQDVASYDRFTPSWEALPRTSGAGFGSALQTPLAHVADGNPAALPAGRGVAVGLRRDLAHERSDRLEHPETGLLMVDRTWRRAASGLPSDMGAAWARGPVRVGLGYRRTVDERIDQTVEPLGTASTYGNALDKASVAAAYVLDVPGLGRLVPGVRASGLRYRASDVWRGADEWLETSSQMTGLTASAGAVLDLDRLPLRVGVSYETRARLRGTGSRSCGPAPACPTAPDVGEAATEVPAKLEASLGGRAGRFSADATLARVFWNGLEANRDLTRNRMEGHVNARYAVRPGLVLALGAAQTGLPPFRPGYVSSSNPLLDRLLLVGATLRRGPVEFDASYVNGALLSRGSNPLHLGRVGASVRF